jgi:hypothetical protein
MIGSLAALLCLVQPSQSAAGPYDVLERLKQVDVAWMNSRSPAQRLTATKSLNAAHAAWDKALYAEACRELDAAKATLGGTIPTSTDAVWLRFMPPVAEPGVPATLRAGWAYPAGTSPASIRLGNSNYTLKPGQTLDLRFTPAKPDGDSADGEMAKEMGVLVPVSVNGKPRSAYISLVKNVSRRIRSLQNSQSTLARAISKQLQELIDDPAMAELDLPVLEQLDLAEQLDEKRMYLWELEQIPLGYHGKTHFRAVFPRHACVEPSTAAPVNVVIAYSSLNGSENLFFEVFGRGTIMSEAMRRGWVFISPHATETAAADITDWLISERKLRIDRLFVVSHGTAAETALRHAEQTIRANAFALLSPGMAKRRVDALHPPVLSVSGKQESEAWLKPSREWSAALKSSPPHVVQEIEGCESLMLPYMAAKGAFSFFDRYATPTR